MAKMAKYEKLYQEATNGHQVSMEGNKIALLCWVLDIDYDKYRAERPSSYMMKGQKQDSRKRCDNCSRILDKHKDGKTYCEHCEKVM